MPLLWLIWFVAMAVTVIIARPVILRSIAQSGVPEAIESQTEKQVATGYRAVQAAFVTLRGDIQLFPITRNGWAVMSIMIRWKRCSQDRTRPPSPRGR
jgi:hypothetical protein